MFIKELCHKRMHAAVASFLSHRNPSRNANLPILYVKFKKTCSRQELYLPVRHTFRAFLLYIYFNVPITNRSFVKNCDQLTDRVSHRRKFLLIFRHDIAFHHVFLMMQVKGMRKQLPAFTLIYFLQ